jgi:hypothetical protein
LRGTFAEAGDVVSLELDIVRDVSERLDRHGIPFMLTGSMAMNAYAEPRMTRDIDVVVQLDQKDAQRIVAAFAPDYYVDHEIVERALQNEGMFNVIHRQWVFKVDCIIRKSAPYRQEEFARRKRLSIGGHETWVVSKEDLIISKLCWGFDSRSKYQARDIVNLLRTGCDHGYVQKWAEELGVGSFLREIES